MFFIYVFHGKWGRLLGRDISTLILAFPLESTWHDCFYLTECNFVTKLRMNRLEADFTLQSSFRATLRQDGVYVWKRTQGKTVSFVRFSATGESQNTVLYTLRQETLSLFLFFKFIFYHWYHTALLRYFFANIIVIVKHCYRRIFLSRENVFFFLFFLI